MIGRSAFSLVELSIVLVILGLLVGGVLSGQSLIRAAELRSVSSDYARYTAAIHTFRDKYFAIPGDMAAATNFWGRGTATADCVTNSGAAVRSPGTCDGNGNGTMEWAGTSQSSELYQFWRHLALAGLIEGTYTGIAGPTPFAFPGWDSVIGSNVPRSRLSNGGWSTYWQTTYGDANTYTYNWGNQLVFGAQAPGTITEGSLLKPEDAWNIDVKVDDGKPGMGKMLVRDNIGFNSSGSCTTSTGSTDYAGNYNLSSSTVACSFKIRNAM